MNGRLKWFRTLAVATLLAVTPAALQALPPAHKKTFTGEVGDAMCGRKHMEDEPAAECTRACVSHGSKYALIVGDNIYTLDTGDKAVLATLDRQAGKMASVSGTLDGDTITVSAVTAK